MTAAAGQASWQADGAVRSWSRRFGVQQRLPGPGGNRAFARPGGMRSASLLLNASSGRHKTAADSARSLPIRRGRRRCRMQGRLHAERPVRWAARSASGRRHTAAGMPGQRRRPCLIAPPAGALHTGATGGLLRLADEPGAAGPCSCCEQPAKPVTAAAVAATTTAAVIGAPWVRRPQFIAMTLYQRSTRAVG